MNSKGTDLGTQYLLEIWREQAKKLEHKLEALNNTPCEEHAGHSINGCLICIYDDLRVLKQRIHELADEAYEVESGGGFIKASEIRALLRDIPINH